MAFQTAPATAGQPRYTPGGRFPVQTAPSPAPDPSYKDGKFIPEVWSSKLLEKFYDATVLAAISNTDYEGEIQSYGDTVHIRTRPDITIRDYVPDQGLQVDRPSSNAEMLVIDQAHYFNLILDDIWKTQADLDMMNMWSEDASEQMKIYVDRNVLAGTVVRADPDNVGSNAGRISQDVDLGTSAAPRLITKADVLEFIVDMGQVLDEQNIPETGRFLIIPTWVSSMVKKSELRDASLTGDGTSLLRNGRLGIIDRFTLYSSNLMPSPGVAGAHYMMAGHTIANTFAAQLTEMEQLRSEFTFGSLVRGLMAYGFETVKGSALSVGVVAKG
jgi:hypothetical protein